MTLAKTSLPNSANFSCKFFFLAFYFINPHYQVVLLYSKRLTQDFFYYVYLLVFVPDITLIPLYKIL